MKYAALCLNTLALILLAWGLYGIAGLVGARLPSSRLPAVELRPLPDKALADQKQVNSTLDTLAQFADRQAFAREANEMTLLAVPPLGTPGAGGPSMPRREVTLLARTSDGEIAVVDGRLVRKGARLADGGRLSRLTEDSVVVTEKQGRQTLSLPLEQLRVGTLRAPNAGPANAIDQHFKPEAVLATEMKP
ncbi:MAG: hypothetical protein JOY84_11850 [Curvibacter sp.]|nr:hypothetical protein [Curvibacter sp.]